MLRKILLAIILLLSGSFFSHVYAQATTVKEFPKEQKAFIEELKKFFADAIQESSKQTLQAFIDPAMQAQFNEDDNSRIVEICNVFLTQHMKASGDFDVFLNTMMAIKTAKLPDDKIPGICETILDLMVKNKKDYRDFIGTALLLVSKGELFDNTVKRWTITGTDYTFKFVKEPVITFTKTDLQLYTPGDTSSIFNTSGEFSVTSNKWRGHNGEVYWTRVGFTRDAVRANLKKYTIDTRNSEYTSDSVTFFYPKVFNKGILGRFSEKATSTHQGERASYPRFTSYQNIFKLKNVFKNIDYKGGFTLEGDEIKGTGTDSNRAEVTITYNGKVTVRALSKSFLITPEKISAAKAAVSIYLDNDSIFHGQCVFNFQNKQRKLTISRKDEGLYAAPFSSSYHQVEFTADNIFWDIDDAVMDVKSISSSAKEAIFESSFFYNAEKMIQMQGILDYQPVTKLRTFYDKHQDRTATLQDVANYFNNDTKYIENLLFLLGREGFVFYDAEGSQVIEKQKLIHYDNAANKNEDYDVIKFKSLIVGKPNAKLDLKTNDFNIQGVDIISISDSQQTYFVPENKSLVLKKNRDMVFGGQVHSGRFDFWGKNFYFNYDSFKVNLSNIDSVKFKFPQYDSNGKFVRMRDIQNSIQNVSGYINIDSPSNKSGRINYVQFPRFVCTKQSFVYYNRPSIFKGVYTKEKFYFKVDPFTIENLDKFTAKGLKFPGTLYSSDIIPEWKNALSIQPDFSLGFIDKTPSNGFVLYKKKGTVTGTFDLSNRGFRGDAVVDYLVSHTTSKDIIYFPDSMNSKSDKFEMPEGADPKYPPVMGTNVYNHFRPYQDSMYVFKRKDPIQVYKGKINFEGYFILTPAELVGNGMTKYENIILKSEKFSFFSDKVKTEKASLELTTDASQLSALSAKEVSANLDLTKDFADFKTNSDTDKVQLPSNVFATTLNNFTYDIKTKEVVFNRAAQQQVDDAFFISNNSEQEQLSFTSSKANYNLNDLKLKAHDVPFLLIADSRIATPNNELTVEKNGVIGSIKGAIITTSDKNQYHKIYDAVVNIFSKSKFTGFGYCDYIDVDKKVTKIYYNDIHTTPLKTTVAIGKIADTSHFALYPKMLYQGEVTLYSTEENLWFNGFVKPDHNYPGLRTEWVAMSDTIEPENVVFDMKNPKGMDGKDLFCGTFISADSTASMYTVFYGKKNSPEDKVVFSTSGIFFYEPKKKIFVVGEKYKLNPPTTEDPLFVGGNTFKMDLEKNTLYTEGLYNFNAKFKVLDYSVAGSYTLDLPTWKASFDVSMIINFPFNDDAMKFVTNLLLQNSYTLPPIKISGKSTFNAFAMMMKDKKDRNRIINELTGFGYIASADVMNKTFSISKVKMIYNDSSKAFISDGDIGLATLGKTGINKSSPGTLMIKAYGGKFEDVFGIFIEPTANDYIYFKFVGSTLNYLASDLNCVDKIKETAQKTEKMKKDYKLQQSTVEEVAKIKLKQVE